MRKHVALLLVTVLLAACYGVYQPVAAASGSIVIPDDYPTIQQAINAATDGACIYVRNGVYPENVVVDKAVTLVGEDWERTVIIGNLSEGGLRPLTLKHSDVTVKRMALVDSWQGIALVNASNCNIISCKILNNHYGVLISSGSNNSLIGNVFSSVKFGSYAIQLIRTPNNLIQANQITNLSEGIAIDDQLLSPRDVVQSFGNKILDNLIAGISDKAVWFKFTRDNILAGNTIANSTSGLALIWTDNNKAYGNNFVDNQYQVAAGKEPIFTDGSGIRYSICQWTNSEGGNYWSDYTGRDANGDGFGDTPYVVNEANSDPQPLMKANPYPQLTAPTETNFPTASATSNPTSPTQPSDTESSVAQVIAALIVVTVVCVAVALVLFFKKRAAKE